MALDSTAKRAASAAMGLMALGPGVIPDAAKGDAWRAAVGYGYLGSDGGGGGGGGLGGDDAKMKLGGIDGSSTGSFRVSLGGL